MSSKILTALMLAAFPQASVAKFAVSCTFDASVSDQSANVAALGASTVLSSDAGPFRPVSDDLVLLYELPGLQGVRHFVMLGNGTLVSQTITVMPDGRSVRTQHFSASANSAAEMGVFSEIGRCKVDE